jgi:ribonuclease HI
VVWYSAHLGSKPTNVTRKTLFLIQKLGAQAVVKCFKTVSTKAASAEAALLALHTRLQLKIARF